MKIPTDLPKFDDKRALIIVASKAHAEFYRANGNELVKAESFKIGKPEFSDQKSYLSTSSRGSRWKVATSSVENLVKRDVIQRFDKRFKEYIKALTVKDKYDEIYIFSPAHFETEVEGLLPANLRKKVKMVFKGNYHKSHPLDLLKKLGRKPTPSRKVSPEQLIRRVEADKIMRKNKNTEKRRKNK